MSRLVTIASTSTMSALNMAMNGNAYKMIEIKKVSGPVVPLRWVVIKGTHLLPGNFDDTFSDKCSTVDGGGK